jgi:hypothetical protein
MNIWVNPRTGIRDRSYRPYINEEELNRNVVFYDPNSSGWNTGLYSTPGQPSCTSFQTEYFNRPVRIPEQYVDNIGRLHRIEPDWKVRQYQPLAKNINPNYT